MRPFICPECKHDNSGKFDFCCNCARPFAEAKKGSVAAKTGKSKFAQNLKEEIAKEERSGRLTSSSITPQNDSMFVPLSAQTKRMEFAPFLQAVRQMEETIGRAINQGSIHRSQVVLEMNQKIQKCLQDGGQKVYSVIIEEICRYTGNHGEEPNVIYLGHTEYELLMRCHHLMMSGAQSFGQNNTLSVNGVEVIHVLRQDFISVGLIK